MDAGRNIAVVPEQEERCGRSDVASAASCSIPARASGGAPGYGQALKLEPFKAALVIVDMQRFFTKAPPFQAMRRLVAPVASLLPVARASGMAVGHVKTQFRPDMGDAGRPGSRTRLMMGATGDGLVEGSPGADICPISRPGEPTVVKRCFDPVEVERAKQEAADRERQEAEAKAKREARNTFEAIAEDYIKGRTNRRAETDAREIRRTLVGEWGSKPIASIAPARRPRVHDQAGEGKAL